MGYRVAIAGASGYAGGELLRLVSAHPDLEVVAVTAHGNAGQLVGELHPNLRSVADAALRRDDRRGPRRRRPRVPGAAARRVLGDWPRRSTRPRASSTSVPIIASSTRRRTRSTTAARTTQPWTYGLPELPGQRAQIAAATRVANTGCHAVAVILAAAPLIAAGLASPADVVVTSASGTSGAGRSALPHLLGSEVMGDLSAYKVGAHRHVPEIKQAAGLTSLTMTPVLAPMPRGILASVSLVPHRRRTTPYECLAAAYADEPFVHVLPPGQQPHTAATAGSNSAHLQVVRDADSGRIVVTSAIDNLGKGAAGQALQNANLMLGLPETAGLSADGVAP